MTNQTRPNIVFILADDLGWMDTSLYGSDYYETPNIERMADRGMMFTNAYAANPLCQSDPGQYPDRAGPGSHWFHFALWATFRRNDSKQLWQQTKSNPFTKPLLLNRSRAWTSDIRAWVNCSNKLATPRGTWASGIWAAILTTLPSMATTRFLGQATFQVLAHGVTTIPLPIMYARAVQMVST